MWLKIRWPFVVRGAFKKIVNKTRVYFAITIIFLHDSSYNTDITTSTYKVWCHANMWPQKAVITGSRLKISHLKHLKKSFDYFCHDTMVTVSTAALNPWWMLICGLKTRSFLFPRHCLISDLVYNRILRWIWMFLSDVIHSVAISIVFSLDLPALYSNGVTWSWSAVSKPVLSSRGSINATGLQFGFVWCFSCDTEMAALITWRWLQC